MTKTALVSICVLGVACATYAAKTGLRGTIEVTVESEGDICRSGFWPVAER